MFQVLDNSNMLQKINNNAKYETEYRKQNEKTEQMRLVKRRLLKSLLCQKKKNICMIGGSIVKHMNGRGISKINTVSVRSH